MKTHYLIKIIAAFAILFLIFIAPIKAQQAQNILDQNISIFAEDEPLIDVIKKICDQFKIDFDYNSKLL